MTQTESPTDIWSRWLLNHWHGGDLNYRRVLQSQLTIVRDRVLDGVPMRGDMTILDVGSGDGLIGLGAIARAGPAARVIFVDYSAALLQHLQKLVHEMGLQAQCSFIYGSAERLDGIATSTVDAVTTRACLAYVRDKPAALSEFYRVLKPGGHLSIAEPVYQDHALETLAIGNLIASQPNHPDIDFLRLYFRLRCEQIPTTERAIAENPLTNYSERDLFHLVHRAGFKSVQLELAIEYKPPLNTSWETFLNIAPHPWAPSPAEVLELRFSPAERQILENGLRRQIESATVIVSDPLAFIRAQK